MRTSANFGFALPSSDGDDIADINQISYNFERIDSDVQRILISGTNIKTINGESVLGEGDIDTSVEVDQAYSPESENAQSGTAVAEALAETVGSIDTALDAIIALQNSYIGGESV